MQASLPPFLAACQGKPVPYTPIWFMRQAGRSLPEYRARRGPGSILDTVRDPALAAELTLQPVRRYGVDAAVLFSDIVVPLVGFGVDVAPGTGPVVEKPFRHASDLDRLRQVPTPYVAEAVRLVTAELAVPLIGLRRRPLHSGQLPRRGGPFDHVRPDQGADVVRPRAVECARGAPGRDRLGQPAGPGGSGGGCGPESSRAGEAPCLPPTIAVTCSPPSRPIVGGLAPLNVPRVVFGVGTGELLSTFAEAGADVVGVDWRVPLDVARSRVGPGVALQGNLDPTACLAPWPVLAEQARAVLALAGPAGHVFNLGHGVLPATDPDQLARLVELVHTESARSEATP